MSKEFTIKSFQILIEHHIGCCTCSYCTGSTKLRFGLNMPKIRNKTSWRIIKIGRFYIRWTLPSIVLTNVRGREV